MNRTQRRKQSKALANGFILHRGKHFTVVATGFTQASRNEKTGPMIQVWIVPHIDPVEAVRTGLDSVVCLDCPLRGDGHGGHRACYVNVGQAPRGVYFGLARGIYPPLRGDWSVFRGKRVRFGAYGEPVLIPEMVVRRIAKQSAGWTGYTHQWRKDRYAWAREFFMASCDTDQDRSDARATGWRYFATGEPDEFSIVCPSETKGTKCTDCLLCRGCSIGALSITIPGHGSGAKYLPSATEKTEDV